MKPCIHLAAVLLTLQHAHAAPTVNGESLCAEVPPTPEYLAALKEFAASEPKTKAKRQFARIVVPVYVHIVSSGPSVEDGNVYDETISAQFTRSNDDFRPHGIQFVIRNTTRTLYEPWASGQDSLGMKRYLRQGDYDSLNFYVQNTVLYSGFASGSAAGIGFFPQSIAGNPDAFYADSVQLSNRYLPGGNGYPYDQGGVGTHEIGHWMGLRHPFEGNNCNDPYGDYVADTPAMIDPPGYCDDQRDSCPNQPGLDPWNNHMNYVPDSCKEIFTQGQEDLMYDLYSRFRTQGLGDPGR